MCPHRYCGQQGQIVRTSGMTPLSILLRRVVILDLRLLGDFPIPQVLQLPPANGSGQRADEHIGHDVQESGLRGIEEQHDRDRRDQATDVCDHVHVQVDEGTRLLLAHSGCIPLGQVGDEDRGNDDVTQAEHSKLQVAAATKRTGEHQLDRRLHALGHGDHDVGAEDRLAAEDPKHIVEEQANKHDGARLEARNPDSLDAQEAERDAKDVVNDPILRHEKVGGHCAS
mmetsp:Transcript_90973/g.262240  ORF Transcript_90973/g.262240 Transcript_90973/m.262240 type:complete len:227 (+) Transcript_90973:34-714(+)